jgi:hypothetical protein
MRVFFLADFAQPLPHIQYLMPPASTLSAKKHGSDPEEVQAAKLQFDWTPID